MPKTLTIYRIGTAEKAEFPVHEARVVLGDHPTEWTVAPPDQWPLKNGKLDAAALVRDRDRLLHEAPIREFGDKGRPAPAKQQKLRAGA